MKAGCMGSKTYRMEEVSCNLCGSTDATELETKTGPYTGLQFPLVRCRKCGLLYFNPRLTKDDLISLYDETYYSGHGFDATVNYIGEYEGTHRGSDAAYHVRMLKLHVPPPAKILDVGCGAGHLIKLLEREGYTVDGIDVSDFAVKYAQEHNHAVWKMDLCEEMPPENIYDAVVAIEVIEHLYDAAAWFRNVYRALKPGGFLYYQTGNFRHFRWQHAVFGRSNLDSYASPEGHVVFFSNATARRFLKQSGFSEILYPRKNFHEESRQLTALFNKAGLLKDGTIDSAGAAFQRIYWLLVRLMNPLFRPALPLARK